MIWKEGGWVESDVNKGVVSLLYWIIIKGHLERGWYEGVMIMCENKARIFVNFIIKVILFGRELDGWQSSVQRMV